MKPSKEIAKLFGNKTQEENDATLRYYQGIALEKVIQYLDEEYERNKTVDMNLSDAIDICVSKGYKVIKEV